MKRKVVLAIVTSFICFVPYAQQLPHYTQYVLNNFILNPAVAGIENYTDVKISHRHQWVGIDGAPVTTYLTIHGPIKKSDYARETATGFRAEGENPRGKAYWQNYEKADPHAGIGLTILNDRTGPLNRFSAYGTYAYHIGISSKTSLSAGISAGIKNTTLNAGKLSFDVPVDPAVAGSGYLNRLTPDMNAGIWLYSADYFAGLSAQNIIPSKIKFSEDTVKLAGGRQIPHMFLTAGYRFFVNDDVSFLPSALIKYVTSTPVSFDVNAKLQYRDFLWVGASMRYKDSWAAMAGLNISNAINIGYSYDITTSQLNTVSRGSHEIVVGFLLGNRFGDWCPRNLW
ncbi:PorP/SprF family type IX secretion system membrane protein [Segetibacter aerophilus]|uniref:Membrane protein n=1 Tax=Segetibacter aerophilus TaxID=670293 RepID=A0A512B857_9BACT|nr:type IX secretion system membrane protein PorP/SprF [Segetibacter aerophilus]GEO08146.1 membrane protein [Segetibacter aerophilus]